MSKKYLLASLVLVSGFSVPLAAAPDIDQAIMSASESEKNARSEVVVKEQKSGDNGAKTGRKLPESGKGAKPSSERMDGLTIETDSVTFREEGGRLRLYVDQGRFVSAGAFFDSRNRRKIESLEDVEYAMGHVDLDRFEDQLLSDPAIMFGSGERDVVAFVDPHEPASRDLIQALWNERGEISASLIVLPGSDANRQTTNKIVCAAPAQRGESLVKALSGDSWKSALEGFNEVDVNACMASGYMDQVAVANILDVDVNNLPYVVRNDDAIKAGPESPGKWSKWVLEEVSDAG